MPRVVIEFKGNVVDVTKGIDKVQSKFTQLDGKIAKTSTSMSNRLAKMEKGFNARLGGMARGILRFGSIVGTMVAGGGLALLTKQAVEFETAIANVGTLLGDSLPMLDAYEEGVKAIAKTTSKDLVDLTSGLYDAISAGISSTEDAGVALEFLNQAQRAAVAGLSTTKEAVQAGAIVLNVYGKEAGSVAEIYDKFFQTVRDGVTTFPALAQNLGNVATAAKAAGVSFNETLAGIAQLTKGGVATSEATTQLRQLFLALAAPTKRVAKYLKEYGIEVGVAAIKNKGLSGVLSDVISKTGGNLELIRRVLGSQEALNAALILGKENGALFADELGRVATASGAAGEAFDIQSQTMAFQLGQLRNEFAVLAVEIFDGVQPKLSEFLKRFREGLAGISATDVSDVLVKIGNTLGKLIGLVSTFSNLIIYGIGVKALAALVSFTVGGVLAMGTGIAKLITGTKVLIGVFRGLPVAAAAASVAMRGFGAALRFALGPIGLVIIGMEALMVGIAAVGVAINKADSELAETERRAQEIVRNLIEAKRQLTNTFANLISADQARLSVLEKINEQAKRERDLAVESAKSRGDILAVQNAIGQSFQAQIDKRQRDIDKIASRIKGLTKDFGLSPTAADLPAVVPPSADAAAAAAKGAKAASDEADKARQEAFDEELAMQLELDKIREQSFLDAEKIKLGAVDRYTDRLEEAGKQREENEKKFGKDREEREKQASEAAQARAAEALAIDQNRAALAVNFITSIAEGLDGIFNFVGGMIDQAIGTAIEAGDILTASLLAVGGVALNKIKGAIDFAGATKPGEFKGVLSDKLAESKQFVDNLVANLPVLFDALGPFIDEMAQKIIESLPKIVDAFVEGVPKVIEALARNVGPMIDAIVKETPRIINSLAEQIPTIVHTFLSEVLPRLPAFFTATIEGFIDAFTNNIGAFIEALVTGIVEGIGKAFEKLVDQLNPANWFAGNEQDVAEVKGALASGENINPMTGLPFKRGFSGGIAGDMQRFANGGIAQHTNVPTLLERGEGIIRARRTQEIGGSRAIRDLNEGRATIAPAGAGAAAPVVNINVDGRSDVGALFATLIERAFTMTARSQGANVRTAAQVVNQQFPGLPRVQNLI